MTQKSQKNVRYNFSALMVRIDVKIREKKVIKKNIFNSFGDMCCTLQRTCTGVLASESRVHTGYHVSTLPFPVLDVLKIIKLYIVPAFYIHFLFFLSSFIHSFSPFLPFFFFPCIRRIENH